MTGSYSFRDHSEHSTGLTGQVDPQRAACTILSCNIQMEADAQRLLSQGDLVCLLAKVYEPVDGLAGSRVHHQQIHMRLHVQAHCPAQALTSYTCLEQ